MDYHPHYNDIALEFGQEFDLYALKNDPDIAFMEGESFNTNDSLCTLEECRA